MDRDADGLTRAQGFALIVEMDSARQLLAAGEFTMRNARYIDPVLDAVLTTTSIGVEKLLKVALGHSHLSEHGSWPTKPMMRDRLGHGSVRMYELLREQIEIWLAPRGRPSHPHELVDRVDQDQTWPRLLEALDAYGRSGRFFYLDELAEEPQAWESPRGLWQATEAAAVEQHPHLQAALGGTAEALEALPLRSGTPSPTLYWPGGRWSPASRATALSASVAGGLASRCTLTRLCGRDRENRSRAAVDRAASTRQTKGVGTHAKAPAPSSEQPPCSSEEHSAEHLGALATLDVEDPPVGPTRL